MHRLLLGFLGALCACTGGATSSRPAKASDQRGNAAADVPPQRVQGKPTVEPAPAQVMTPSPPWPEGYGPRCAGYKNVSTMDLVSCAVCNDGSVHCWGATESGVLVGRGGRGFSDVARIDSVKDAELVANNFLIACLLRKGGKVACWGEWDDRLSRVQPANQPAPAKELREVPLPHAAVEIAVGGYHACAILSTEEVACWGRNDWGQVGVMRDASSTALPRILPGLRAARLAVSGGVSCAIDLGKQVWCWGWNGGGALGTGGSEQPIGPVRIRGISDAVELAIDSGRVCAQTVKGAIWCWGGEDESGFSGKTPLPSLRRAPAGQLAAVDEETFSVVTPRGDVYVVGLDGSTSDKVADLPPVQSLAGGNGGSCAILASGALRCWGTNLRGELVLVQKKVQP